VGVPRDPVQPQTGQSIKSIRALVADDSPVFLSTLVQFLARSGAVTVVATASHGREAVEQAGRHQPDLAIVDVRMPDMNGLEAAAEMRCLSPAVRIVMISIDHDGQTEADCLRHGADGFVPKVDIHRRLWPEIARLFPHLAAGLSRQEDRTR